MDTVELQSRRLVSGMRPTGRLHLGHYHGVLKNWIALQHEYDCFFFVADWHAFFTHYEDSIIIRESIWNMVIDWLAVGIEPSAVSLFLQSKVPEHAELHLLLSAITPMSWLERVPTYKDQQEKLKEKDLSTYGFLGYPLLQSADILIYRAGQVPVGEDQVVHVELTREVARRFNHIYGREKDFEDKAQSAIKRMSKKNIKLYIQLRTAYQEQGDVEALDIAKELLKSQQNLALGDSERLFGYLEGGGKVILPEPQAILTRASKMPGLDGQKMSNSYGNTIALREPEDSLADKIKRMPTDTNRIRRSDPGDPDRCSVWQLHEIYSTEDQKAWVQEGCRTAKIGCLNCKGSLIDVVAATLRPIRKQAEELSQHPEDIRRIIEDGNDAARAVAQETLIEVRAAMGLDYK
ncbi:MAG: tryptophan--tRNA ligase [Piscirickettsiaceae bacterium]|nr:tryptophan--tRNA ligase [Piscirickettsiaceae bacterium]